jgi:hypothetical protein
MNKTIHRVLTKLDYNTKLIKKDSTVRIYNDAHLISPGEWTDSTSMMPIVYSAHELNKASTNWEENYLNVDHSWSVKDRIGYVMNPRFHDDMVKGDLHIYPITEAARTAVALVDAGLVNWVSVELRTEDRWDEDDEKIYAENISFIGTAIVTHPACKDAIIK